MASADITSVQEQLKTQVSEVMRTQALLKSLSTSNLQTAISYGLDANLFCDIPALKVTKLRVECRVDRTKATARDADKSQMFVGNGGNDRFVGGHRSDVILAGSGADTLNGGAGSDFLYGGVNADILDDCLMASHIAKKALHAANYSTGKVAA